MELKDYEFTFLTPEALLTFKKDPTLESIKKVRELLDGLTDQLIIERIEIK